MIDWDRPDEDERDEPIGDDRDVLDAYERLMEDAYYADSDDDDPTP